MYGVVWRTPCVMLAHPIKYINMVCKRSFYSIQDNGQAKHGLPNNRIAVVVYLIPITTSAFSVPGQIPPGPIIVKCHRGTGLPRWTELHRWVRLIIDSGNILPYFGIWPVSNMQNRHEDAGANPTRQKCTTPPRFCLHKWL